MLALIALWSPPVAAQAVGGQPAPRRNIPEFLACHDTVVRNLEAGDTHSYQFVLQQGEVFAIDAVDTSGTIELLRLRLIAPDGRNLGSTCTGRLPMRAPVDGVYILEVRDCIGNEAGTYALTMNVVSDTVHSCAQPIACAVEVSGALEVGGQADSYAFYGTRNEPVSLDFRSTLERRGGLEVRVFDPNGIAVLHSCGSTFDFNLPTTGRFTVLVNACLGKNTGTYDLVWRSRSCPTHIGAHSAGGGIGLRLSPDGSQLLQIAASSLSCAYNDSSGFVVDLNPPLTIVDGRFAASIPSRDANTPAIQIDGVFVDDERTQLLGGMSVLFGHARCNFQWAATSEDDDDWDGWSDDLERALGSRSTSSRSTPESSELPTTALFGPGVCRDRYDNDADGNTDAAASACVGAQPATPSAFTAFAGRHSGAGAFSIERSADGSRVTRLVATNIGCGALVSRGAAVDVDIPIRDNRFIARSIVVGGGSELAGLELSADGVFFDGDGDTTREQALGGIVLRFGSECRYKWWASAHVDTDGDGWGDVAERRYSSDARPMPSGLGMDSMPEADGVPVTALSDVATCSDGVDNDGNHFVDSADWKCPRPSPTPTSTSTAVPTVTPTRTPSRTSTPTPSPTPTLPPTEEPTATVPPMPATNTPVSATATSVPSTSTPLPTQTASLPPTETPTLAPTQTPTSTPTNPAPVCAGDCDGNGRVTIDEVIRQTAIGLGDHDPGTCRAGDVDGNGTITVDEVLTAVNHALRGCPSR